MLNRVLAQAAAVMLLLTVPAGTLMAQAAVATNPQAESGVIYPQAGVTVKGSPVYTSTAVYAGDEIKTGGVATMVTGEGVSLQIKPHTSLIYGKAAELGCGGVVLTTSKAIPVRYAGIEVTPEGNPAQLEINNAGGTTTVSVRKGAAVVNQAGQISRLQEGQVLSRPATQPCPVAAAGSTHPAPPSGSSSLLGGRSFYWIIGGAASAGVVAGVLATRGDARVSPSVP